MTGRHGSVYVFPQALNLSALSDRLNTLTIQRQTGTAPQPFQLLDCHDQSLRKSNQVLLESGGEAHLIEDGRPILTQSILAKGQFVQNLPDGPVKNAIRGVPKLRALISWGEGQLEQTLFVVQDDLQKIHVRGEMISLTSSDGQVTVVSIHSLRGYEKSGAVVCDALRGMRPTRDAGRVIELLFPSVMPYNPKPEIVMSTDEPSIQVAKDIIEVFLKVARQNEWGAVADIDTEFLHDYRVSLRRIRSVLSLFKGVFSEQQTRVLKQEFSDLMAATGRLRDLDVYLLEKDSFYNFVPSKLHPGVDAMFGAFQAERNRELINLSRHLQSKAYTQKMDDLTALFADVNHLEPGPNADRAAYDYACALIWKRYRKVCKIARRITVDTPDDVIHALRIDCKKLRYLMEFFAPLFEAPAFKTIIKPLKKLQNNLGYFNDYAVQQDALMTYVSQRSATHTKADIQVTLAVGGLIAVLSQRQAAERDRVMANFAHFDSEKIRALFQDLFHRKER